MIHARADYNRIQDPATDHPEMLPEGSTAIGDDEPVMLFRAQDKNFVGVLIDYRSRLLDDVEMPESKRGPMVKAISEQIRRANDWQVANGCKTPDI